MRVGNHIGHNLYDDENNCIGHMHTDEAAAALVAVVEARNRTIEQMKKYIEVGTGRVNAKQVINLLSLTWPDGNFHSGD